MNLILKLLCVHVFVYIIKSTMQLEISQYFRWNVYSKNNFQRKMRNSGICKDYGITESLKRQKQYTGRTNIIFDVSRFRCLFSQQSNISWKKVIYCTRLYPRRIIVKDDNNGGESFALSTSEIIREWWTKVTFDVYSYNSPAIAYIQIFQKLILILIYIHIWGCFVYLYYFNIACAATLYTILINYIQ